MNKRIKELMVKSGAYDHYEINEGVNGDELPMVKFAELIVRECANRLRETDYELIFVEDGMCDPSISDAMLVAASDIEEHFGVK